MKVGKKEQKGCRENKEAPETKVGKAPPEREKKANMQRVNLLGRDFPFPSLVGGGGSIEEEAKEDLN